ncbi:MAG: 3-deoxy-D-manno-octulosonic acid transferase [Proteobacteria bacterium]|nr:3-deoxy-D-manno-octulosonic acid transferase [Pseudomonadota bacterium]
MTFSPALTLYRAMSIALAPLARPWLDARTRAGKEDAARLGERFGDYPQARPAGRLMWFHAASVGESGVALALIEALAARDASLSFLLTTGTRTSAELAAKRAPPRTTHVYAPVDRRDAVQKFLAHWRPDAGVFVESELWPNLILEAKAAGVRLALVNARMSPKTLSRWQAWPAAANMLLSPFDWITAADTRTAESLSRLRDAPVAAVGNLKLATPAPHADAATLAALAQEIGARPVWLAASTHAGEDEVVLAAHRMLREQFRYALLIIAPRHPERGPSVSALAGNAPRRGAGRPIGDAPVYVADTLGELGVLYSAAPIALVAGSLLPALKGHNPIEPAKIGSAILTGPYVESFQDVFDALIAARGAQRVADASTLAKAVASLWRDAAAREAQVNAARVFADQGADALEATLTRLADMIPDPAHAPA